MGDDTEPDKPAPPADDSDKKEEEKEKNDEKPNDEPSDQIKVYLGSTIRREKRVNVFSCSKYSTIHYMLNFFTINYNDLSIKL